MLKFYISILYFLNIYNLLKFLSYSFVSNFNKNISYRTKSTAFTNTTFFLKNRYNLKLFYSKKYKLSVLKLYKFYINNMIPNHSFLYKIHDSFKYFFINNTKGGFIVFSVTKFLNIWKNFYFLFLNLFFYKVNILYFSNTFFKKEILAINWCIFKNFTFLWKFTKPILCFTGRNSIYNFIIFNKLRLFNLNIAFVFDIVFHKKTIHNLHKSGFFTIAPVPYIYNRHLVNLSLPVSNCNHLNHLFFFRFIFLIQKYSIKIKYNILRNYYLNCIHVNI